MKKKHILVAALCLLGAGLAACSGDDESQQPQGDAWFVSIPATKGGGAVEAATRALSFDGSALSAAWSTGESVTVVLYGADMGTLHPDANAATANLTGTLREPAISYGVGQSFDLWFPRYAGAAIDYTGQKGTLADIASNFDYAHATATITAVNKDTKTLTVSAATFTNPQAIVRFTLKDADGNDLAVTSLEVYKGENLIASATAMDAASSEVWMAIPPVSGEQIALKATTAGGTNYQYTRDGATFKAGSYYPVNVKMKTSV